MAGLLAVGLLVPVRVREKPQTLTIGSLLRPHRGTLALGALAAIGEAIAGLLEPWPIKVVFDNVLKSREGHGWVNWLLLSAAHGDKYVVLQIAAFATLLIAIAGALCAYSEKYITSSVGQWVMHELRRTLYSHIQRLSLAYHDRKCQASEAA